MSAALGVTAGAGAYVLAITATVAGFLILVGLAMAKPLILDRVGPPARTLRIEYERGHGTLGPVLRDLERGNCQLRNVQLEDDEPDADYGTGGLRRATIEVRAPDENRLDELVESVRRRHEVRSAGVEHV
jgi:uncharacterized membrane protein YhiD involved in acid resistance